jgi:hypothetical protein
MTDKLHSMIMRAVSYVADTPYTLSDVDYIDYLKAVIDELDERLNMTLEKYD